VNALDQRISELELVLSELKTIRDLMSPAQEPEPAETVVPKRSAPVAHLTTRPAAGGSHEQGDPERNGHATRSRSPMLSRPPKRLLPLLQALAAGPKRMTEIVELMEAGATTFRHLLHSPLFRQCHESRLSPWELTPEGEKKLRELEG
jgi:hypothetical protein